jgi:hypothetical protein
VKRAQVLAAGTVVVLAALAAVGWGTAWFGLRSNGPVAVAQVPSTLPSRGVDLVSARVVLTPWKRVSPHAMPASEAIAKARRISNHRHLAVSAIKAELTDYRFDHVPVWLVTYTSPKPINVNTDGLTDFYVTQFSVAVRPVTGKLVESFDTPYPCRYAQVGSSLEVCEHAHTVQWESGQRLGDARPTVLRTETYRDLGGNPETVTTVRGHFKLRRAMCRAPKPVYQRPCGPVPTASWAWLIGDGGYAVTTKQELAAIDSARRANPLFSVFPDFAYSSILCSIASGDPAACSTKVVAPRTIQFLVRWPLSVPAGTHPKRSGWIVNLDRENGVRSIRQFGEASPF